MLTLEKLYESVFEHITDRDFVRFIEEPEEVELLSEKDCKLAFAKERGGNPLPRRFVSTRIKEAIATLEKWEGA